MRCNPGQNNNSAKRILFSYRILSSIICAYVYFILRVNTNLKLSGFGTFETKAIIVYDSFFRKPNPIVLHCYNQPLTKPDSSGWWRPCIKCLYTLSSSYSISMLTLFSIKWSCENKTVFWR